MAVGIYSTTANNILNAICKNTSFVSAGCYAQLHTDGGEPGAAGTSNISATNTRNSITFANAASGGTIANTVASSWTIGGSGNENLKYLSLWSASSSGTFLWSGQFTATKTVSPGDTFQINIGDLTLTIPIAS